MKLSTIDPVRLGLALSSEGCAYHNTVLILLAPGALLTRVVNAGRAAGVGMVFCDRSSDLTAVPACLAVLDPRCLSADEWQWLCSIYQEANDLDMQFLLPYQLDYTTSFLKSNWRTGGNDLALWREGDLTEIMLRSGAVTADAEDGGQLDDETGGTDKALCFLKRNAVCCSVQRWVGSGFHFARWN